MVSIVLFVALHGARSLQVPPHDIHVDINAPLLVGRAKAADTLHKHNDSSAVSEKTASQAYFELPATALIHDKVDSMEASYYLNNVNAQSTEWLHLNVSSSAIFFVKAALLILLVLALMFVYSQTHEVITERTGLKMTHVCCAVYATLSIAIDLSIKNAAEAYGGSFPFNPACGVIVVESCKLIFSVFLFALHVGELKGRGETPFLPRAKDVGWLAVPAAIYATNNLLVFQAIKSTPLATFGVLRETMLIWNALIWTAVFQQPLSTTRWLCIAGIFSGCALNQLPKMFNDSFSPGVIWSCLLAFSNACGAVANEYAMKQRAQLDINLQNAILYGLCGSFVLIGLAIVEPAHVKSPEAFFAGFVPECWTVIILQTFTGLAVSRILKYVEAVTKTIVAAIRGPGVIFIGAAIFHTRLGSMDVFPTVIVCVSCWFYLRQGPLVQQPEVSQAAKEAPAAKSIAR